MATSGSYNFALTRDEIITAAHQYIGVIAEGQSCSASQISEGASFLNMLMKAWAADGMPLWSLKRGIILPFTGSNSIATSSHVVTTYDVTTINGAEAAGQTALTVASITGFSASDQIGIELDDGTIDWTTVNGAPSGTTITVTTGLTSAASVGNRVFGYTASSDRIEAAPLRVFEPKVLNLDSNSGHEINQVARGDFFRNGDLTSSSIPNQFYYDPGLDSGTFHIYPRFNGGDNIIQFTYHRPFQDFDATSDNPDCPQAFYLALTIGLSALLGPKAGVPPEERAAIMKEAMFYKEQALTTVAPEGSVYFGKEDVS